MMSSVLDDTNFILYGPDFIHLTDLFDVHSALSGDKGTCVSSGDDDQHEVLDKTMISTPGDERKSVAFHEPETTRQCNDNFEYQLESQLEYVQSQNSFHAFSPLSPISPIQFKSSQSPTMSHSISMREKLDVRPINSNFSSFQGNGDSENDVNHDDEKVVNHVVSPDKDCISLPLSSPLPPSRPHVAKSDTFLNSSSLSSFFDENCKITEEQSLQEPKKNPNVNILRKFSGPDKFRDTWTLPLKHSSNDSSGGRKHKKQQTLCSSSCTSHAFESDISQNSSSNVAENLSRDSKEKVPTVEMTVADCLDDFNADIVNDNNDLDALIFSYYHLHTYKTMSDILLQKSFHCHRSRQSRRRLRTNKRLLVGGVLIVTSKRDIPYWDSLVNCHSSSSDILAEAKFHCYTDPLSKRRKFGAYRLASHDIVLTTFDILRAKEVAIPLDESESSDSEDEIRRSCRTISDKKWLTKRKEKSNNDTTEWSNLHLIHWDRVIIDHRNLNNIRRGTVRGDVIVSLRSDSRISVVEQESPDIPLSMRTMQDMCDFLEIRSDSIAETYTKLD